MTPSKYKLVFTFATLAFNFSNAIAEEIATCGNLEGFGYYHYAALLKENQQNWEKDSIKNGITTLKKLEPGKYDILMIDSRQTIFSLTQDGGRVVLIRKGQNDATFMHFNPVGTIELYTFWRETGGKLRMDLVQSKGGDGLPVHKSSVLVGDCRSIRFELID